MDLWLAIVIIFEAFLVGWILGWFGVKGLADKVQMWVTDVKMFLVQKWLRDSGYTVRINEAENKEHR